MKLPLTKKYDYFGRTDLESKYPFGAYDGDTIDFFIDLGHKKYARIRVRVLGVNTAEMRGPSKALGETHRELTRNWLKEGMDTGLKYPFLIETVKKDAFGRFLATVKRVDTGTDLSQFLLDNGVPTFKKR